MKFVPWSVRISSGTPTLAKSLTSSLAIRLADRPDGYCFRVACCIVAYDENVSFARGGAGKRANNVHGNTLERQVNDSLPPNVRERDAERLGSG